MLHDIGDEVYRCEYNLIRPADYDNDYIIVMDSEQMLLIGEPVRIPRICELLPPEKAAPEKL
ncbi:MAG: hypothetical protein ILP09_07025, partial [Oscillospiraceae bacterium]|nr:hypothetical protein [Oscillospiraceae bacterium]